jgi:hypothetical protein
LTTPAAKLIISKARQKVCTTDAQEESASLKPPRTKVRSFYELGLWIVVTKLISGLSAVLILYLILSCNIFSNSNAEVWESIKMVKHYESVHQSDLLLDTKEKSGDEKEYEEFIVDSASPQWWVARSSWKLHAVVVSILLVSVFHNGLLYHRNQALEERVTLGVSRYSKCNSGLVLHFLNL